MGSQLIRYAEQPPEIQDQDPQIRSRQFRETTRALLEELADLPLVGRSRAEYLNRMNALLEAKTAVVVAVHNFSDNLTDFINWSVPVRELQTDVRALLRELYLEM